MLELESQPCRQQDGSSSTTTVSSSLFTTYTDFFNHANDILFATTTHLDLVYTDIDKDWAKAVLDTLDENSKSKKLRYAHSTCNFVDYTRCLLLLRKHYNSETKSLWFCIMPTEIHDCHQYWVHEHKHEWLRANLLTSDESKYLRTRVGTSRSSLGPKTIFELWVTNNIDYDDCSD